MIWHMNHCNLKHRNIPDDNHTPRCANRFYLGNRAYPRIGDPASAASASDLIRSSDARSGKSLCEPAQSETPQQPGKGDPGLSNIVKAGFMVGAQSGNGVLFEGGLPTSYYNISAASYGLQAGVQSFSYALFFMTTSALSYLSKSHGGQLVRDPSVVVLDEGAAASMTSTTLSQDVYAIPFGQIGLMAGIGLRDQRSHPSASALRSAPSGRNVGFHFG